LQGCPRDPQKGGFLDGLNKWSWVNWRWILFFSQVAISFLTLGFCFYMIAKYQDKSQKSYWPIVTIIVGCECLYKCHC
jgi:hypothetical protein